jgi:hypothetical protein
MDKVTADKVTLADVLRFALPLNTRVVGSRDTDRVANWVAVRANCQPDRDGRIADRGAGFISASV